VSDTNALLDDFLRRLLDEDRLGRLAEWSDLRLFDHRDLVERGVEFTKRHLYTLSRAGKFPTPLLMGAKLVWRSDEVARWITGLSRAHGLPAVAAAHQIGDPVQIIYLYPDQPTRRTTALRRGRRRVNGHKLEAVSAPAVVDQSMA
jgi:predicted DNA-binding transcriptional regulator AlpA